MSREDLTNRAAGELSLAERLVERARERQESWENLHGRNGKKEAFEQALHGFQAAARAALGFYGPATALDSVRGRKSDLTARSTGTNASRWKGN